MAAGRIRLTGCGMDTPAVDCHAHIGLCTVYSCFGPRITYIQYSTCAEIMILWISYVPVTYTRH